MRSMVLARSTALQAPPAPVYTAGGVARMLGISARKVHTLFDSGLLGGYVLPRTPGATATDSGDRRIPHRDLVAFCRTHGVPAHLTGLAQPVVLLASFDASFAADLAPLLGDMGLALEVPTSWYALGRRISDVLPAAVLLDCAAGRKECLECASEWPALCVLLASEDSLCAAPDGVEQVAWPWTAAKVAGAIVRRERDRRGP